MVGAVLVAPKACLAYKTAWFARDVSGQGQPRTNENVAQCWGVCDDEYQRTALARSRRSFACYKQAARVR